MTDKSGGDNAQIQSGNQHTGAYQDQNSVAAGGTAAVNALGADAMSAGLSDQAVQSAMEQAAYAAGGTGGSDNINTNTNLNIS